MWLEGAGRVDFDKLFEIKSYDWIIKYLIYVNEEKMRFKMPVSSHITGKRIETMVIL